MTWHILHLDIARAVCRCPVLPSFRCRDVTDRSMHPIFFIYLLLVLSFMSDFFNQHLHRTSTEWMCLAYCWWRREDELCYSTCMYDRMKHWTGSSKALSFSVWNLKWLIELTYLISHKATNSSFMFKFIEYVRETNLMVYHCSVYVNYFRSDDRTKVMS